MKERKRKMDKKSQAPSRIRPLDHKLCALGLKSTMGNLKGGEHFTQIQNCPNKALFEAQNY